MATRPRVARPCGCCASWSDAVGGSGALRTRRRVRRHRPVRLAAAGQAGHQGGADRAADAGRSAVLRSEEHTSELQSLMRISYAVFCLKKKKQINELILQTVLQHILE